MELRVVGAGVGRTGTHSLKIALERLLGAPCHHMMEILADLSQIPAWTEAANGTPDWGQIFARYAAVVDWPGAAFWRELHAAYPDALVLLSVRDADDWYRSVDAGDIPWSGVAVIPGRALGMSTLSRGASWVGGAAGEELLELVGERGR